MSDPSTPDRYTSTGDLPSPEVVAALVDDAHRRFVDVRDGACSTVYPALARRPPDQLGICVASVTGAVHVAGDVDVEFTIMSVAKPFTFALVCEALGPGRVHAVVGVNATGRSFDATAPIVEGGGRTNPMVNPGAIVTAGLVEGSSLDDRWDTVRRGLSRFAGRDLRLDEEVLESALATNLHNRAIVEELVPFGSLRDPWATLELYTRQSCVSVTAHDLAVMGATLADGGVNPLTGVRVVSAATCRHTLSVMATAGMYETSGDWLYEVGLPGKSGIGGGMVTVSPGKGGLGTYSPRLDGAGNSVRGIGVARDLSTRLGLDIFASAPAVPARGSGGDG